MRSRIYYAIIQWGANKAIPMLNIFTAHIRKNKQLKIS